MYVCKWGRMHVCGDICMYVCGDICRGECIYMYRHTWMKGNRERERKPVAREHERTSAKAQERRPKKAHAYCLALQPRVENHGLWVGALKSVCFLNRPKLWALYTLFPFINSIQRTIMYLSFKGTLAWNFFVLVFCTYRTHIGKIIRLLSFFDFVLEFAAKF
jgi:hypothetical protein